MKLKLLIGLILMASRAVAGEAESARLELAQPAAPARARVLTIDDFEDKDRRAASGLSWITIADDLMGGASSAGLEVVGDGSESGHALRAAGEVGASGFAGAWVALDGGARATDVSDFQGIRLRIRGSDGVQVGLRAGGAQAFNYMAPVDAGPDWSWVEIPFDGLRALDKGAPALDRAAARWLGVSVGRDGRFRFEIDDVALYGDRGDARLRVQSGPSWTVAFEASPAADQPKGPWRPLAQDAGDDGKQKRLPDATDLAVSFDEGPGRVWFRVALAGPVPKPWLGVNLALDIDGDQTNGMAWWGTNQSFRFDRLVTVYGFTTGSGYEGMIGIADAAEVEAGNLMGSNDARVQIIVDQKNPALLVGFPRQALGKTATAPVRVVAAVGSAMQHNDDVPDSGAALVAR